MYQGTLEPISNRADWYGDIQLVNDDTGEVITDLTGVSVTMQVRRRTCGTTLLSATSDNGDIVFLDGGVIEWHFTPAQLSNLCASSYDVGITVTRDGVTDQELIATLPVIDGIVR